MRTIIRLVIPCATVAVGAAAFLFTTSSSAASVPPGTVAVVGDQLPAGAPQVVVHDVVANDSGGMTFERRCDNRNKGDDKDCNKKERNDDKDRHRHDEEEGRDHGGRDHVRCHRDRFGHEICESTSTTSFVPPTGGGDSCFDAKDVGTLFPANTNGDETGIVSGLVRKLSGGVGLLHDVNCDVIVPAGL